MYFIVSILKIILQVRSLEGLEIQGAVNKQKILVSGRVNRFDEEIMG